MIAESTANIFANAIERVLSANNIHSPIPQGYKTDSSVYIKVENPGPDRLMVDLIHPISEEIKRHLLIANVDIFYASSDQGRLYIVSFSSGEVLAKADNGQQAAECLRAQPGPFFLG